MRQTLYALPIVFACAGAASGYESAFARTNAGVAEIKTLGPAKALAAATDGVYFDTGNALFGRLFRYIRDHNVAMTVPVQAEIQPARMLFFVGAGDAARSLPDTEAVTVETLPQRQVASLGARGGYSRRNFERAAAELRAWLAARPDYEAAEDAYAVYWSSPFVPAFLKRYEVHIPVRRASD